MEDYEVIYCFIVFINHLVPMLHIKNPPQAPLVSSSEQNTVSLYGTDRKEVLIERSVFVLLKKE